MVPYDQKGGSSGFGQVLAGVGAVASIIGTAGAALAPATGAGALFGMTASQAGYWSLAGSTATAAAGFF